MSGILNIAYSGLNAFQNALSVTANNITNATTKGYSRQGLQLQQGPGQRYAGSFMGSGVVVGNVYRNVDQFATAQVRNTQTVRSQYESFYNQAIQIDRLLSQDGNSVSTSMQSFFDSLGQLNSAPDSIPSRSVVLSQSQLLVDQFHSLQMRFDEYQSNSGQQISEAVNQINQITTNLAAVNAQLMSNSSDPGLLDSRDELVRQLAQFSEITVSDLPDGSINVGLASGEMLVTGTEQRNLSVKINPLNTYGTSIYLETGGGKIEVTNRITTGMLGGILTYADKVLGQSSQLLGQMAIGLAQTFNAQHALGMDMNNNLGQNFFTDFNSPLLKSNRALSTPTNSGTGNLSVAISDISQTKLSDYSMVVSDTATNQVRLIRNSDGVSTTLNWSSNPPAPPAGQLLLDGMTITVDDIGNLQNSDTFTIMPTRGAARDFDLNITDARQIALASPARAKAAINNAGSGQIALGSVFNTNFVANPYTIDFTSPTTYNIVDVNGGTTSGPFSFVPNTENTIQIPDSLNPSYSVVLSGIPDTGDQFNCEFNSGGIGDNGNGKNLSAIQQGKIFSGGSASLFDNYSSMLASVGGQTNQAKIRFDSADVLYQSATDFRDSKSGVNLDEEGANLMMLKQSYEAAGKLLEISSQIMDVLFQIMR